MQSQPNDDDALAEGGEQRPSLVRELLCAAIHSRAAYGYAMAAGHMSTLLNFALMHTVHQIRCVPPPLPPAIHLHSFTCCISLWYQRPWLLATCGQAHHAHHVHETFTHHSNSFEWVVQL